MTINMTRVYSKTHLKAHMLEIMRELEDTGEEAVVTDHGRPVLKIVPLARVRPVEEVFAPYRGGGLRFLEDPDEPTLSQWPDP